MVSKPKFIELFSLNVEGNAVMHQVFKFWISLSIPDRDIYSDIYSYSKLEGVRNCAEFSLFFAAKIFGGGRTQNFWTSICKLNMNVAKCRGDWPTDIRDLIMKKRIKNC